MHKTLVAIVGGLLVGFAAAYVIFVGTGSNSRTLSGRSGPDIVAVPRISVDDAAKHKANRYTDLSSFQAIQGLPFEFDRAEAAYSLVGRSNSAELQGLAFEAAGLSVHSERQRALSIVFMRLTQLDPQSAIALARTSQFKNERFLADRVWRTWARMDLDGALAAVKALTSSSEKGTAAQTLFIAMGYIGNDSTDRIQAELGIAPSRSTRSSFLYRTADRSPVEAIAYINSMDNKKWQTEFVGRLAAYLAKRDTNEAQQFAKLFDEKAHREKYEKTVRQYVAKENPMKLLQQYATDGGTSLNRSELRSATSALVANDLVGAMGLYEQLRNSRDRKDVANIILSEYMKSSPEQALAWARANDTGRDNALETKVLIHIATSDPQTAIDEALSAGEGGRQNALVHSVLRSIASNDAQLATEMAKQIDNAQLREGAMHSVVSQWVRNDAEEAFDWILAQDEDTKRKMLTFARSYGRHVDLDTLIRVVPDLPSQQSRKWRRLIAGRLVSERSVETAMQFVSQFEGTPDFEHMQASVISSVAADDPMRAKQMVDQIPNGDARDQAYASLIERHAKDDPETAAKWLESISDPDSGSMTTGTVAAAWMRKDPDAAMRWMRDLPVGTRRDTAIMHAAMSSGINDDGGYFDDSLLESVTQAEIRTQVKVMRIFRLAQADPEEARRQLRDLDLSDFQRQQTEQALRQFERMR